MKSNLKLSILLSGCWAVILAFLQSVMAEEIKIRTDFPGGNVLVQKIEGNTVHIAPDLRGGRPWFYWNFEAEAATPGKVRFVFPAEAGDQLSVNGPAVSLDEGKTWNWLGADKAKFRKLGADAPQQPSDEFEFDFAAQQKVRFSVGIPYLQSNLDKFIASIGENPHLNRIVLTRSRQGRPIQLWKIGQPADGVTSILVSARHHACEAMASYVLEGFLQEALSNSPAAVSFRQRYVIYAVPIVDVDGVELGDQGKWRSPHDHNRDYGQQQMIYPPVIAMVQLAKTAEVQLALDFHCPTIRMDIHQGFYYAGIRLPHIKRNLDELTAWMDEERPPAVIGGERDLMSKPGPTPPSGGMPFSNYFAYQPGVKFAATLECPFTQPGNRMDAALAKEYGKSLLRAWQRTEFVGLDPQEARSEWESTRFVSFKKNFQDTYKTNAAEAESLAAAYLDNPQSPAIYRTEAHILLGTLRTHQRQYPAALKHYETAFSVKNSTTAQRATAAAERARLACLIPDTSTETLAAALQDFAGVAYPSAKQVSSVSQAAMKAYADRSEFDKALPYAVAWSTSTGKYDRGSALNHVAGLYDKLGQKEQAVAARKEAVEVLRKELKPVPVGVFGPMMAADLLEALNGIPTSTDAEKQAAADIALKHKLQIPSVLTRIRTMLKTIE